jgi:hypothetical protein
MEEHKSTEDIVEAYVEGGDDCEPAAEERNMPAGKRRRVQHSEKPDKIEKPVAKTDDEAESARKKIEAIEASLPKRGLTWSVVFPNSELFSSLIKIASPILSERIRFYPAKKKGFTGILIDEFDPSHSALMIGRLVCPVKLFNDAGEEQEVGDVSVTVPTESIVGTLKGMSAQQSVAMYQINDSANVFFSILDSSTGHVRHDDIPTLCGGASSSLRTLTFQYELTIGVEKFKEDLGHVSAKGIAVVNLSLRAVSEKLYLLVLSGKGDRGNTFASMPISLAPTQERLPAEEAGGGSSANLVHTVASLQADQKWQHDESGGALAPVCRQEIEALPVCYSACFNIKYLEKMTKSLKENSLVTLFCGDTPSILPLIMRFPLDMKRNQESFSAFVLAANVDETN